MKLWERLNTTNKRLAIIAGLIISTGVISVFVGKTVRWAEKYAHVPVVADSLKAENEKLWDLIADMHEDQRSQEKLIAMLWQFAMAQGKIHNKGHDYFISLNDGNQRTAFLRQDDLGEHWVFYKVCKGGICKYYLYQAIFSKSYMRFYFVDDQGNEHLIYRQ
jgi:hypothetical protein